MLKRIVLSVVVFVWAVCSFAADKPGLSIVIGPDGRAAVMPVFPGRDAATVRYRFFARTSPGFMLSWVDETGWPAVADFAWPADFGSVGPAPTPGPIPPVPPTPTPTPTPEPVPPADLWGLVIIEESKARTPEQAAVLTSPEIEAYCVAHKLYFRLADQDEKDADGKVPQGLAGYIARAKKATLPQLFIVDVKGQVRYEGGVPATVQAVIDLLTKNATGAKQ